MLLIIRNVTDYSNRYGRSLVICVFPNFQLAFSIYRQTQEKNKYLIIREITFTKFQSRKIIMCSLFPQHSTPAEPN